MWAQFPRLSSKLRQSFLGSGLVMTVLSQTHRLQGRFNQYNCHFFLIKHCVSHIAQLTRVIIAHYTDDDVEQYGCNGGMPDKEVILCIQQAGCDISVSLHNKGPEITLRCIFYHIAVKFARINTYTMYMIIINVFHTAVILSGQAMHASMLRSSLTNHNYQLPTQETTVASYYWVGLGYHRIRVRDHLTCVGAYMIN